MSLKKSVVGCVASSCKLCETPPHTPPHPTHSDSIMLVLQCDMQQYSLLYDMGNLTKPNSVYRASVQGDTT